MSPTKSTLGPRLCANSPRPIPCFATVVLGSAAILASVLMGAISKGKMVTSSPCCLECLLCSNGTGSDAQGEVTVRLCKGDSLNPGMLASTAETGAFTVRKKVRACARAVRMSLSAMSTTVLTVEFHLSRFFADEPSPFHGQVNSPGW